MIKSSWTSKRYLILDYKLDLRSEEETRAGKNGGNRGEWSYQLELMRSRQLGEITLRGPDTWKA